MNVLSLTIKALSRYSLIVTTFKTPSQIISNCIYKSQYITNHHLGAVGEDGIDGSAGSTGGTGEQGIVGPEGLAGEDGHQGQSGVNGEGGPVGEGGATGPQVLFFKLLLIIFGRNLVVYTF